MKKILTLVVFTLLVGTNSSFAGTKYTITYTNMTPGSVTVSYNQKESHCWHQDNLPGSVEVASHTSSPSYETETKDSGTCFFGGSHTLALDISMMGSTSACQFTENQGALSSNCSIAKVSPGTTPQSYIIYISASSSKSERK